MIRNIGVVWLTLALGLVQVPPREANVPERNLSRSALDQLAQAPVIVKVSVLNEETGAFALDLKAEDFIIEENGVRQKPTRFLHEERPLSILLLIDSGISASLIIKTMIEGVSNALKHLKADDEVALMSFNQELDILQDFTKNKGSVEEKLRGVRVRALSLTKQALFHSAKHMLKATAPDSHRVIVVLTANRSSGDVLSEKVVMQQLSASARVVCGIIVSANPNLDVRPPNAPAGGRSYPDTRGGPRATDDITTYVDETGGIVETVKEVKPQEISARLGKTIDAFRNYYWIEYFSPDTKRDGSHRKLKVTLSPDMKKDRGKLTVLAKRGYYAPNDTASGEKK